MPMYSMNPLATSESINQIWSINFMLKSLLYSRHFRTFNVVDDFNREVLTIELKLISTEDVNRQ